MHCRQFNEKPDRMLRKAIFSPTRPDAPRRAFTEFRSRVAQRLNVQRKVRFASSFAAVLLKGFFEHPVVCRGRAYSEGLMILG